jgi:hypothetical protein
MENSETKAEKFAGASFVGALDEYTKRMELSVAEIDANLERLISTSFVAALILPLAVFLFPVFVRYIDDLYFGSSYRSALQGLVFISIILLVMMAFFVVYRRLMRLRRVRRNLSTLLWPYEKLLQKLTQLTEQGRLDEGNATLIQLKLLEAEVAYGKARRLNETKSPFAFLVFGAPESSLEESDVIGRLRRRHREARILARRYRISTSEAERLIERYGADVEELEAAAGRLAESRN